MFAYIWPVALVVLSNIFYHIAAKSSPLGLNPMASLTVTYLIGALTSFVCYFLLYPGGNFLREMTRINFAPLLLGVAIVGLEVGTIYAYRSGWQISMFSIVQSSVLAIALIAVGYFLYHENLSWNKLVGIGVILVGLVFVNLP